ncbi:DUF6682 family protein [Marinobacter sp. MDS2]|uniref:phage adaptor protein n=1 Tax=Marinobacter sp. MDS2 TaxID=3065961 RepID=UPI00273B1DCF|nr:DUF6682 family protein [Marinobacter sp. MDS2]MDP4546487.1 hypothetical protein [Marinobacter sp. MDS2]
MAVTVAVLMDRAKRILQEIGAEGIRWTNAELGDWLNEFYVAAVAMKPSVSTVNEELQLVAGTKQSIPAGGERLLDVIRNTVGAMPPVFVATRRELDTVRRTWHSDEATTAIERFVFDELDPRHFYVYPPAAAGAAIEILYAKVPDAHDTAQDYSVFGQESFRLSDAYVPAAVDYLLYRAFSKDAQTGTNLNRAQLHLNQYLSQLTGKAQADQMASPNSPDTSANPPGR